MSSGLKLSAAVLAMLMTSCSNSSMDQTHAGPTIELLYFQGCAVSNELRTNLKMAIDAGDESVLPHADVDMGALDPMDDRLRWGSPTILVDGRDLFDTPPAGSPGFSCRVYDRVPSSSDIEDALARRVHR